MLDALDRTLETLWEGSRKLAQTSMETSAHLVDSIKQNVESSHLLHQGLDLSEQLLDRGVHAVENVISAGNVRIFLLVV